MLEFAQVVAFALFFASCFWLLAVTGGLPRRRVDSATGESSIDWSLRPSDVHMGRVSAAVAALASSGATGFALGVDPMSVPSFLGRWLLMAAVLTAVGFLSAAMGIGRATGTG